jgi:hypothetical protein
MLRYSLIATSVLTGCVWSKSVAIGPRQAPKPENCPLEIVEQAPEEVATKFIRVGSVCLASEFAGGPSSPPLAELVRQPRSERAELLREACSLGGDAVAVTGSCSVSKTDGTEFAVLRKRSNLP